MKIRHLCWFCVIPAICRLLFANFLGNININFFILTKFFGYKLVILEHFFFVRGEIKIYNQGIVRRLMKVLEGKGIYIYISSQSHP